MSSLRAAPWRMLKILMQAKWNLNPAVSEEEIVRLLEAAPGPKYKAAFAAAYGAGLRISEVVALKVSDIDSKRMLLKIEQGKGRKDRFAMLSPVLLELLRDWYRIARPTAWLFPGRDRLLPITHASSTVPFTLLPKWPRSRSE